MLLILSGCKHHPDADIALKQTEDIIEQSPDSADIILSGIDTNLLTDKKSRAYYNYLSAYIAYKTFQQIDSDGLKETVECDFIANDTDRLGMALYLLAMSYHERNQESEAYSILTKADDITENSDNHLLRARIISRKAYILAEANFTEESIGLRKAATTLFQKAGNDIQAGFELAEIANSLNALRNYKDSEQLSDSIFKSLSNQQDSNQALIHYVAGLRLASLIHLNRLSEASELAHELVELKLYGNPESSEYSDASRVAIYDNDISYGSLLNDTALMLADNVYDSIMVIDNQRLIARKTGDWERAYFLTDSVIDLQNRIVGKILLQSPQRGEVNALTDALSEHESANKRLKSLIFAIVILFLLCVISLLSYFYIKARRERSALSEALKKIEELSSGIEALSRERIKDSKEIYPVSDIEDKINTDNRIYEITVSFINHICKDMNKANNKWNESVGKSTFIKYGNALSDIDVLNILPRSSQEEINAVDKHLHFTDEERTLVFLLFAGFSPTFISMLTDSNINTIYSKRRRLIERLESNSDKLPNQTVSDFISHLK